MNFTIRIRVCQGEDIKTRYAIKLFHMEQRKCDPLWCTSWNTEQKIWSELWMKNNVHPRSGTQQCSAEFTTRHHFKSLYVVSLTSNINITKIYSSSCVWCDWTNSTGLLLPVKQVKKYAEPMAENNTDLTDRFPLLCNNYFSITLFESTVYLHDCAI